MGEDILKQNLEYHLIFFDSHATKINNRNSPKKFEEASNVRMIGS